MPICVVGDLKHIKRRENPMKEELEKEIELLMYEMNTADGIKREEISNRLLKLVNKLNSI